MVKQRMSSADVAAEVACLRQRILGLRVANIYDLTPKTYVIKLARSGEDGEKVYLLLESGSRFHTTKVGEKSSDLPSNFTLKLRKHCRTRRVEAVRQLGVDRCMELTLGSGPAAVHLILEMYAQGNVVLTDYKYEVLTLLRSHRDDAKGLVIMARHPYPMSAMRLASKVTGKQLDEAAAAAAAAGGAQANYRALLSAVLPYGPTIAEHVAMDAGFDPNAAVPLEGEEVEEEGEGAATAATAAAAAAAPPGGGGALPADVRRSLLAALVAAGELVFAEFSPLPLLPYSGQPCLELSTFDDALDEFYSKIEGQRAGIARADAERAALSKLDKIKLDQGTRAEALLRQAEECELKAQLITYNLEMVDAVLLAVNQMLATGMDWSALADLVRNERRAGNPVAALIASLELENNRVSVLLANTLDDTGEEGEEEAMTRKAVKVASEECFPQHTQRHTQRHTHTHILVFVDLSLSAAANASTYFEARRRHLAKHAKTLAANEAALAAAEKKVEAQLKQVRAAPPALQPVRKPMWFERFHWFISSENYLVVSGRDAQQNELLVKRYFRKGDVYVHAELHGTTICVRWRSGGPIPPLTLQQAGCACVCRSRAWDSKLVTSAWWVHHQQVSKTAPTGEYLTTGSFMIRGKKNFLPPQPLVMGFGFLFKLDDSSIPAHLGERAVRGLDPDGMSVLGGGSAVPYSGGAGGRAGAAVAAAGSELAEQGGYVRFFFFGGFPLAAAVIVAEAVAAGWGL
ncbi:hypothetical protein VOLCADRAFT_69736 [Volvox carteri f. nagariensis]|uniref:NFACT RNA-binding domain-containing protein n=1 Tax=Volvox carteri f. nagariensis TaxID=3068 RepID=D8UIY9_VOLCA|nr:uncharacterized protein VOLCADRAFT_69736 [Volvox carteri f. nagariensis]EFJ40301.1 hypothetical protein VOLCADRAFT_69736 [Volvox carteri f. nagariensis]|eukprot:XP_002958635.1 hypothetical protein VOLCADRAFT_69736 [Volvox carteri f. nagariensis]